MERDLDLGVVELVRLVGAAVPDPHRAGAVAALRDVALELEVLERVVLGVDRHAVVLRVLGDPVRDRPGDGDAVVLEAQVPVQARRVVLLHDEPGQAVAAVAGLRRPPAPGCSWSACAGTRRVGLRPPGSVPHAAQDVLELVEARVLRHVRRDALVVRARAGRPESTTTRAPGARPGSRRRDRSRSRVRSRRAARRRAGSPLMPAEHGCAVAGAADEVDVVAVYQRQLDQPAVGIGVVAVEDAHRREFVTSAAMF